MLKKRYWCELKKFLRTSLSLAKVNFILRTEGDYLGILWYLLNPLVMFLIILLVKKHAFLDVQIENYPLYLFMGITGFNFFKQALSNSITSVRSNIDYIKSINTIAPETFVVSGVIQAVFSHFFEFILIVFLVIYLKVYLIGLLFYPFIFLFFILFVLGISFIFATIGVYLNDFDNIWSIIVQLLFFISPIFYVVLDWSSVYIINLFNPLFYFLTISRTIVINFSTPPIWMIIFMIIFSVASLVVGFLIFKKNKNNFTELI